LQISTHKDISEPLNDMEKRAIQVSRWHYW